jgi:tRNA threonylcarbamoyl adenosine modification protein (Sua5/YciO/YrdC/YwlC family)
MPPRLVSVVGSPPDPALVGEVVEHLLADGMVALATETVYGFGCALRPDAIQKILALKERGVEKPFLVLVPDLESTSMLEWTDEARELAEVFWPGALTLVLRDSSEHFPPGIRSSEGTVAVRMTPHPLAHAIVESLGEPIVSTSANEPGAEPALSAEEAMEAAIRQGAGEDLWVLDSGTLPPSTPSTIVDCSGGGLTVVRGGVIPSNRLRCVLPDLREDPSGGGD